MSLLKALKGDPFHQALGVAVGIIAALVFFGLSRVAFMFLGIAGIAVVLVPWSLFYITYLGLGLGLYRMGRIGLAVGHLIGWLIAVQVGLVNLF